ncbi:MAG: flagellar filament capping protein FliD [Candidatus Marinimicrobia bacterium]|nr:flagellar filament capping protein FliD [Candidatus Neomarinimicrobiota bacterium]
MSTFNISGISSGIDWGNMIDQLIEIEMQPVKRIESKQKDIQTEINAWQDFNTKISTLQSSLDAIRDAGSLNILKSTLTASGGTDPNSILSISTDSFASNGTYDINVDQLATKQKISSQSFSDKSQSLNLSGDVIINDTVITIESTDSLLHIRDKINNANISVSASVNELGTDDYRLVLTSESTGKSGISILDASASNVMQSLGLVDSSTTLREQTSDGAKSSGFSDSTTAVGTLLGLSTAQSGTVTIGGQAVSIDLAADSLTDIATKIDAAAGVSASVVSETADDGSTVYKIDVSGTTSFSDSNNVLQTIGFLANGFSGVNETHVSDKVNTSGGTAIADATSFAAIDGAGVVDGDTISFTVTDRDGNEVTKSFEIDLNASPSGTADYSGATVNDLLTAVEDALGGSVNYDAYISDGTDGYSAGSMVVQDLTSGSSALAVSMTTNNEGGGTLDFGTISAAVEGYDMEIQSGQNASFTIDGVVMSSESNTIDDVITGVSMDLLSADPGTTVTLDISQDNEGVKEKVDEFITAYNTLMSAIGKQFEYSEDDKSTPVLSGDGTLRTVQMQLRSLVLDQMDNYATSQTLADIGIHIDQEGMLSLDETEFNDAINGDFNSFKSVFEASGFGSTSLIDYVRHSDATEAGTYNINITTAPERATVTGAAYAGGTLSADETIEIVAGGQTVTKTFAAGTTLDSIVDTLNQDLDNVTVSKTAGNEITLTNNTYGTTGFEVTSSAFGIAAATYSGVDIAGTIDGEAASGSGNSLKGLTGNVEDLRIEYNGSATGDVGTVTVSFGFAEMAYRSLEYLTDPSDGFVNNKIDSLNGTISRYDEDIEKILARIEIEKQNLTNQFVAMERAISNMNAQSEWLSGQIAGLAQFL